MSVGGISSAVSVGEISVCGYSQLAGSQLVLRLRDDCCVSLLSVFESLSQFSHVVVVCSGDLTKPAP